MKNKQEFDHLAQKSLSGCNLCSRDLRRYDLAHCQLTNTRLINANLLGASFEVEYVCTTSSKPTRALSVSPDGVLLASGAGNSVYLWDAKTGHFLRAFTKESSYVTALSFAPTSPLLAAGNSDSVVTLWNLVTGDSVIRLRHCRFRVSAVQFSPDETILASSGSELLLLNLSTTRETVIKWHCNIQSICFTPDGQHLVCGGIGNAVYVVHVGTGKETKRLRCPDYPIWSVSVSPDGSTLAVTTKSPEISLWDFHSGTEVDQLIGHVGPVLTSCFSPNGQYFVSGASDGSLIVWDVRERRPLQIEQFHSSCLRAVSFTVDSAFVISGGDDAIICKYRVAPRTQLKRLRSDKALQLFCSDDCECIAAWMSSYTIVVWSIMSGAVLAEFQSELRSILLLKFSPNNAKLAVVSRKHTTIWEISTGTVLKEFKFNHHIFQFTPDSQTAVLGAEDGLSLCIIESGLVELLDSVKNIVAIGVAPNSQALCSTHSPKILKVWDLGAKVLVFERVHPYEKVLGTTFSNTGEEIVMGVAGVGLIFFDARTGETLRLVSQTSLHREPLVFSPSFKVAFARQTDFEVCIFDTDTGQTYLELVQPVNLYSGHIFLSNQAITWCSPRAEAWTLFQLSFKCLD